MLTKKDVFLVKLRKGRGSIPPTSCESDALLKDFVITTIYLFSSDYSITHHRKVQFYKKFQI